MSKVISAACAFGMAAGLAFAQGDVVIPNANTTAAGGGSANTYIRGSGFSRTYQQQAATSELASIPVGALITGVQWRLRTFSGNSSSWPATPATWNPYNVVMAQAANPISGMTTTFAANMASPVTVRSVPFSIEINSFPGGVTIPPLVNGWGPMLDFTTPYVYQGGDLVISVEHQGSNIAGNRFLDGITTDGPGYGTTCRAIRADSFAAATGEETPYTITRFHWIPGSGPTNPWGLGVVSPSCIDNYTGGPAHIRVNATPGINPLSTGISVHINGTNIGLGTTLQLFDDGNHNDGAAGDNEFGLDVVIPAGLERGLRSLPMVIADLQARVGNGIVNATLVGPGASESIATAVEPAGGGALTSITYSHDGSVARVFRIGICDGANFSATTFGGTAFDTQLFLFRPDGAGVAHNDDVPSGFPGAGTLASTITSANTGALVPGIYYLAVSSYNRDPIALSCDAASLLWLDAMHNFDRAPDGPYATSALRAWTGTAAEFGNVGDVTIALTSARYASGGCPTLCDGDVNCDFALDGFDVETQEKAVGGEMTDYCQADPDFNGDFALDGFDVEAVEVVVGGGDCP